MVITLPTGNIELRLWQQPPLDARSQAEVVLERAPLAGGEALEANAVEGVVDQSIAFDRRVADLTDAEGSLVHAVEGAVDCVEELDELASIRSIGCRRELVPPLHQLAVEERNLDIR
jgi:hypothetical protein